MHSSTSRLGCHLERSECQVSSALASNSLTHSLSRRFGEAGGFLLSFFYIYLGMCALGLSIEAMITVLTPRFAPFFLFTLVSSSRYHHGLSLTRASSDPIQRIARSAA